jgi:hypothetical protein
MARSTAANTSGEHPLMGELHGGVRKAAGRVPAWDDPLPRPTHPHDLIPQPGHVSAGKHAERERQSSHISVQQRFVVHLLSSDGLDGEDVGPRVGAEFERSFHLVPGVSGPEQRRPDLIPEVGDRGAQRGPETVVGIRPLQVPTKDGRDLGTPLRPLRHGR